MSGNKLGNIHRVTLTRLEKLGSVATKEQLYQAGLITRKKLGEVLTSLEKRRLVELTDYRYWITDAGHAAHGASP